MLEMELLAVRLMYLQYVYLGWICGLLGHPMWVSVLCLCTKGTLITNSLGEAQEKSPRLKKSAVEDSEKKMPKL